MLHERVAFMHFKSMAISGMKMYRYASRNAIQILSGDNAFRPESPLFSKEGDVIVRTPTQLIDGPRTAWMPKNCLVAFHVFDIQDTPVVYRLSVTYSDARVEFAWYPSDFETVDLCTAHDPAAVINPRYCGAEIGMTGR
jgi:hypothetical protein